MRRIYKSILKTFLIILVILYPVIPADGSSNIEKLRPEGSKRVYHYFLKDKKFGELESVSKGKSSLDGIDAFRIDEKLEIDLTPFGNPYKLKIENEHYINAQSFYIGDDMELEVNDQKQELYLKHSGNSISGYFEKDNQKQEINQALGTSILSVDNYMLDQIEIFLAGKTMRIGDTLVDSFFIPQIMMISPAKAVVEAFTKVIYGSSVDSAFVCHFIEPSDQIAYITKSGKLLKITQPSQSITAELVENILDKFKPKTSALTLGSFFRRLPLFAIYILTGIILVFPFIMKNFRNMNVYIAVFIGAISYNLLSITHVPIQEWYTNAIIIPGLRTGGTIFSYAIVSSLMAGLFQDIVKALPIIAIYYFGRNVKLAPMHIGIFCALGFGIYEAGTLTGALYQSGATKIISWPVFERILAILFHIVSGALIGFNINRGIYRFAATLGIVILIHSFMTYPIIFVQKRIIDIGLFEILTALINILLLLGIYLYIKSARKHR